MKKKKRKPSKWKLAAEALSGPAPDMGVTPREEVWKKNKATLWYYRPAEKKYKVPVFLVFSLINQPVILDLGPGMSLIESLTNGGWEVYLLDFGVPGYEDGHINVDDLVVDYLQKGVQRALRHSGAKEITLYGFCLGGTLTAMYAAIAEEPIKNIILSTTPIDFSHSEFDQWEQSFKEGKANFDDVLDVLQVLPGFAVQFGIRLITSPIYYSPYLSLLNKADNPAYVQKWLRFNEWVNSTLPVPGAVMKQLMNDIGKENKLVNGTLMIREKRADLKNITANLLGVAGKDDKLVPDSMSSKITELVSSGDKTFRFLDNGHSAMISNGELPDFLAEWLPSRS
ncbi:alpha/beta fold hydrolase [Peribacillus kribbensis]|uniref:alpha/beta fold hydrolase n=1 Tax=Peribacillus kribbensis TaxID=356658 RepID=UPI0003FCB497|nr:alpha/beta fold hydrolase [Peribacillus kribbensis]